MNSLKPMTLEKDYLNVKTSVFMAESFVLNYPEKIEKYNKFWLDSGIFLQFIEYDYVELVNTEEQKVA